MAYGFNDDKTKAAMVSQDDLSKLVRMDFQTVSTPLGQNVPNNQVTTIADIALPGAGVYTVSARLLFSGSAGGQRRIIISTNESATTWQNQCDGTGNDYLSAMVQFKLSGSGKFYIRALQNSGSSCQVTASDVSWKREY